MTTVTQAAELILGLMAGGFSGSAMLLLRDPYFDVIAPLFSQLGDAVAVRRFLASVGLVFGGFAAWMFTHALRSA
jgi:hypothetical protein